MSDGGSAETTLRLERFIPSSPEDLFALWIEPEQLAGWWAPDGYEAAVHDFDVRPGGRWRIVLRGAGGREIAMNGVFRVVEPPWRLAFSWMWEATAEAHGNVTEVTVSFEPAPGGTRLVLMHQNFGSRDSRDRHFGGWSASFDRLARLNQERHS